MPNQYGTLLASAILFSLSACGGGAATPAPTPTPTPAPAPAPTPTPTPSPCGERCIDLSGASQPAALAATDDVARAAAAVTQLVDAASLIYSQLQTGGSVQSGSSGSAPKAAESCSEGGTREVTTSGLDSARIDFNQCTENGITLDGVLTIQCDAFDSNLKCVDGELNFGESGDVLLLTSNGSDFSGTALFRHRLQFALDDASGVLDLLMVDLEGEVRNAEDQRASFVTDNLAVSITQQSETVDTLLVNGVAGFGGDAVVTNCVSGTLTTATPLMLTVTHNDTDAVINSGRLDFSNTLNEYGSADYANDGITATTGSGSSQIYTAAELQQFCTVQ